MSPLVKGAVTVALVIAAGTGLYVAADPDRRDPQLSGEAIAADLRGQFAAAIPDAMVAVFPPPPVRGVGRAGGFMLMVEDRTDAGPLVLQSETEALRDAVQKQPGITGAISVFRANVPQIRIEADPDACLKRAVASSPSSIPAGMPAPPLAIRAMRCSGTPRSGTPTTCTRPSTIVRSSGCTSSKRLAISRIEARRTPTYLRMLWRCRSTGEGFCERSAKAWHPAQTR